MRLIIYMYIVKSIIFFNQYQFMNAEPVIGQNIRQARKKEFSYIVSIMRKALGSPESSGTHFCTGVLITRKDILTAAHCIEGENFDRIQLVVGTIDRTNGTLALPLWWQTYDQWAEEYDQEDDFDMNDLANIKLVKKVSSKIVPIRISSLSNTDLYNAEVKMAGWGKNNEGICPNIMNVVKLKIIDNYLCSRKIERIVGESVPVDIRILCSYVDPFIIIEDGDSGGPLIFRNRLVAINKGVAPINVGAHYSSQVNLHIGIDCFRDYINFVKYS